MVGELSHVELSTVFFQRKYDTCPSKKVPVFCVGLGDTVRIGNEEFFFSELFIDF